MAFDHKKFEHLLQKLGDSDEFKAIKGSFLYFNSIYLQKVSKESFAFLNNSREYALFLENMSIFNLCNCCNRCRDNICVYKCEVEIAPFTQLYNLCVTEMRNKSKNREARQCEEELRCDFLALATKELSKEQPRYASFLVGSQNQDDNVVRAGICSVCIDTYRSLSSVKVYGENPYVEAVDGTGPNGVKVTTPELLDIYAGSPIGKAVLDAKVICYAHSIQYIIYI